MCKLRYSISGKKRCWSSHVLNHISTKFFNIERYNLYMIMYIDENDLVRSLKTHDRRSNKISNYELKMI